MKHDPTNRTLLAWPLLALGLMLLMLLAAPGCGDDDGDDAAGGGDGDGDQAATPEPCVIPDGSGSETVSLRTDVMPVFSLSCGAGPCHGDSGRAADLYLGPMCMWNADAGACEFPSDASDPNALTDAAIVEVLDDLVGAASTTSPSTDRVVAGDPEASFLMEKVAAIHNDVGHDDCTPQQTGAESPCGDAMPPTGAALCAQGKGPELMDMLARWIAQGAKDN